MFAILSVCFLDFQSSDKDFPRSHSFSRNHFTPRAVLREQQQKAVGRIVFSFLFSCTSYDFLLKDHHIFQLFLPNFSFGCCWFSVKCLISKAC